MRVCWLKLGGWSSQFDERVNTMARHVDTLLLVRPKFRTETTTRFDSNVQVVELYPRYDSKDHLFLKIVLRLFWAIQAFIFSLWKLHNESYDVIHSIDPPLGVSPLLSRLTGIPLVVSIRGLHRTKQDSMRQKTSLWRTLTHIFYYIRLVSFQQTNRIIVKSEHQIEYLEDTYSYPRDQITAIPTGVDFGQFDPEKVTGSKVLTEIDPALQYHEHLILYLGRLSRSKGVNQLLTNIADSEFNDGEHFLFVGEYENDDFRTSIEDLVSERDLGARVTIHPEWLPLERVPELLHSVDTLCLLSEPGVEGVPRVLQEACAMETPIVAANVAGIKEAFQDQEGCFLIERDNSDEFRQAIENSFTADLDRELFREDFDIHSNYGKYADIYRDLDSIPESTDS